MMERSGGIVVEEDEEDEDEEEEEIFKWKKIPTKARALREKDDPGGEAVRR